MLIITGIKFFKQNKARDTLLNRFISMKNGHPHPRYNRISGIRRLIIQREEEGNVTFFSTNKYNLVLITNTTQNNKNNNIFKKQSHA